MPSDAITADWPAHLRRFGVENCVSRFAGCSPDWAVYTRAIELVCSLLVCPFPTQIESTPSNSPLRKAQVASTEVV